MARLVAKSFVCTKGPHELPDGTCPACTEVAEGIHPDVIELDAASRTGVDAMREEIVNRVDFAPAHARAKTYIIDEVHMLTTQAFNALLKTLEEPPAHVYFILCTTDPQKIPETVLSRVQRFDFSPISDQDIAEHLADVAKKEKIELSSEAALLIAQRSDGGMRDALGMLEQLALYSNGSISAASVKELYGKNSEEQIVHMLAALSKNDSKAIFAMIDEFFERGADLRLFVEALMQAMRDVYVYAAAGPGAPLTFLAEDQVRQCGKFEPDRAARALSEFDIALQRIRTAGGGRLDIELAFIKLIGLPERSAVGAQTNRPKGIKERTQHKQHVSTSPVQRPQMEHPKGTEESIQHKQHVNTPPVQRPQVVQPVEQSHGAQQREAHPEESTLANKWQRVLDDLKLQNPSVLGLLLHAKVVSDTGVKLTLELNGATPFASRMLAQEDTRACLSEAVAKVFGKREIEIQQDEMTASAPESQDPTEQAQHPLKPTTKHTQSTPEDATPQVTMSQVTTPEVAAPKDMASEATAEQTQQVSKAEVVTDETKISQDAAKDMMQDIFGDGVAITSEPAPQEKTAPQS